MKLSHYTINTGHTRLCDDSEVTVDVLRVLQPIVQYGEGQLPALLSDYRIKITRVSGGAMFDISSKDNDLVVPVVLCSLCWDKNSEPAIWDAVKASHSMSIVSILPFLNAKPQKPTHIPWLAVQLFPFSSAFVRSMHWLGSFEYCIAWAIIKHEIKKAA